MSLASAALVSECLGNMPGHRAYLAFALTIDATILSRVRADRIEEARAESR